MCIVVCCLGNLGSLAHSGAVLGPLKVQHSQLITESVVHTARAKRTRRMEGGRVGGREGGRGQGGREGGRRKHYACIE